MSANEVRVLTRVEPLEFYSVSADQAPAGLVRIDVHHYGEFYAAPEIVAGPDHLPIGAFYNEAGTDLNPSAEFHPLALVGAADLILAVDVYSGDESVVYRRVPPGEATRTAAEGPPRVLRIEFDPAKNIGSLVALVIYVKGRCDYIPRQPPPGV